MAKLAVCFSTLLVLLVMLVALGESRIQPGCCGDFQVTPIAIRFLKRCIIQDSRHGCNLKAAVFLTKDNRTFCANPEIEWVKRAMLRVPCKRR
ncbi:C-C motif chemokine 20 [Genypterus blacodes]|uniref:C-C motif chemokine 20 n=1 Tax=Genypterus blacodes TaxID=154954 RepID=UPI003F7668E4